MSSATSIHINRMITALKREPKRQPTFWQNTEFYRYSIMAVSLILQVCLYSISIFFIMHHDGPVALAGLIISSVITTVSISMPIGLASMKWVLGMFTCSVLISAVIIVTSILVTAS